MIYTTLITIFIVFFAYQFIKKQNNSFYERGKELSAEIDGFEFMKRERSSIKSTQDFLILHYLINRPWREAGAWFSTILSIIEESKNSNDPELEAFGSSLEEAMFGEMKNMIALKLKLTGIPNQIREIHPEDYRQWMKINKETIKSTPEIRVIRLMSISSTLSAMSCLKQ